eukprot:1154422-Pelagomonas_calceolata.AAC.2
MSFHHGDGKPGNLDNKAFNPQVVDNSKDPVSKVFAPAVDVIWMFAAVKIERNKRPRSPEAK